MELVRKLEQAVKATSKITTTETAQQLPQLRINPKTGRFEISSTEQGQQSAEQK